MNNQLQFPDQLPIDLYHEYFGTETWPSRPMSDDEFNDMRKLPHLDSNYRYLNVGDIVMIGNSIGRVVSLGYRNKNYARPYAEVAVNVYDTVIAPGIGMAGYDFRINQNTWNCQYGGKLRKKDPRYNCEITKLDGLV